MDNSKAKNTHLVRAAHILADADNDSDTDVLFNHRIDKYESLPENDAGEIPEDLDLLNDKTALTAFIKAALATKPDEIDINDLTDRLIELPYEGRNKAIASALEGVGGSHIRPYQFPLGCELD